MRATWKISLVMTFLCAAALASLAGCGSDTEIMGPNALGTINGKGGDAIGSLDGGTQPGGDAWVSDELTGVDGGIVGEPDIGIVLPPDQSCQGKCGKYNPNWSCQCDTICVQNNNCCADRPQVCGSGTKPKCGDGVCASPLETTTNCAQDCKTGGGGGGTVDPGQIVTCLETSCATEYKTCAADPNCAKVLDCAKACTSMQCVQGCATSGGMGGFSQAVIGIATCGQQAGCFSGGTTTGPTCGDGQCSGNETAKSCPQDCITTPPSKCGDGQCVAPETAKTCPQDCSTGGGTVDPGQIVTCLETSCASEYKTCAADAACAKVLACAQACTSMQCVQGCATGGGGFSQALIGVATCGQQAGCFSGGGGTTTPPAGACGDGTCDKQTETSVNCTADCKPSTNTTAVCVQKNCPDSYNACGQTAACFNAVNCVGGGGNPQQCFPDQKTGQLATALLQCGQQAGCFGGGGTTTNSCQGKCGQAPAPGQACGCSQMCAQMGNCCADHKQVCATQPPTPVCGNGTCETGETSQTCAKDCGPAKPICGDGICDPNLETSQTCPKDCGTPPATACKSKADCATDEVCCIQAAGQVCVKIGTCK